MCNDQLYLKGEHTRCIIEEVSLSDDELPSIESERGEILNSQREKIASPFLSLRSLVSRFDDDQEK